MTKYERAAELYASGKSLRKIANRFHVSHIAVRKWLLNRGVEMRAVGRRPGVKTCARKRRLVKAL